LSRTDVDAIPILYSFRRCPYAIRARLALAVAGLRPGIDLELREVNLRARPPELRQVCPRATVPVLVLPAPPADPGPPQAPERCSAAPASADHPVADRGHGLGQPADADLSPDLVLLLAQQAGGWRGPAAQPAGNDAPAAPGSAGAAEVQAWPAGGPEASQPIVAAPRVIDQSLAIMLWALSRRDPQGWLPPLRRLAPAAAADEWALIQQLIAQNDGPFKHHLDRFRYPERFLSAAGSAEPPQPQAGTPQPFGHNAIGFAAAPPPLSALNPAPPHPAPPDSFPPHPGRLDPAATAPFPGHASRSRPAAADRPAAAAEAATISASQPRTAPPQTGETGGGGGAPAAGPDAAAARIAAWRREHRRAALAILHDWNARLRSSPWLLGPQPSLADIALLPFVRQFQLADPPGFAAEPELQPLRHWLARLLAWPLLAEVMEAPWGPRSSWHSPRWLYHLALVEDWRAAQATGVYRRSSRGLALEQVGFVHACQAHQLAATHQRFYADLPATSVRLLSIDPDRLAQHGVPVRFEPAPDTGELFPHLYAALPVQAVLLAEPYRPAAAPCGPCDPAGPIGLIGGAAPARSPLSSRGPSEARRWQPQERP